MNTALLIADAVFLAAAFYILGRRHGGEKAGRAELERGIKATKQTLDTLMEAQKFAKITPKQLDKMNEFVIKKIEANQK